ncbi:O-antigen ligase family protein [Photorhabdus stackebrandtii]|uniref:O-antigen polymerase n=1 Tax=Photorhabdus stackebrandtii TaxID=1123042 RepID=A0A7X5TJV0_9GAMM|nr:O-antigen ligase family protein [Photorhabdus stackebrandtii]NHB95405.1 hypothetical protein [Photorhabdus stackebrandtii]
MRSNRIQTSGRVPTGAFCPKSALFPSVLPLWMPVLLCGVTLIYLPNMGGGGLRLPVNLLTWGIMTLVVLWGALQVWRRGTLRVSLRVSWVLCALVLLSLPWLWTRNTLWQSSALPRLAGLWGSGLVLLALLQGRLTANQTQCWLNWLLLCMVLQALIGVLQLFAPVWAFQWIEYVPSRTGFRPYGIFQQPNLLGSFIATGIGIAGYLMLSADDVSIKSVTEGFSPQKIQRHRVLSVTFMFPALALVPLWAVLLWSQSRIGLIGAVVMEVITLWLGWRWGVRIRCLWLLSLSLLGITLGLILPHTLWWPTAVGELDFWHASSNQERLHLLVGTLQLIAEHPWLGHGLGSFENTWPQALAVSGLHNTAWLTFTHPHNEVFYVWCEGGVTAVLGLVIVVIVWLWPRLYRAGSLSELSLYPLLLRNWLPLPIALHLMTEYPLYQSAPHLMVLLILWRLAWPENQLIARQLGFQQGSGGFLALSMPVIMLAGVLMLGILGGGLVTQDVLTRLERRGLIDPVAEATLAHLPGILMLTQETRLDYDRHTKLLLDYNRTHNSQDLVNYQNWGNAYLQVHNDANVSATLIQIARAQGKSTEVYQIVARAHLSFSHDTRFWSPALQCSKKGNDS